jgi:predicted RNA-binding Zn ribbon-like protein
MFKEALWLREAIYKVCSALAAARDPARKDLDVLHVALVEYLRSATLTRVDEHYDLAFTGPSHVAVVLGPIAQSAVDLLKGGEFHRLKQCPGPSGDCGWLFYDRTKNNSRRWCEMSVCGNRVKARRYQKRMFVAEEVK